MIQTIIITGNIVADAELRSGKEGREFITFRVAVNEGSGEDKKTSYYDVSSSRVALQQYLKKGGKVTVIGHLSVSAVEKDGKAFLNAYVSAYDIDFGSAQKEG